MTASPGERLRAKREARGMTQRDLARLAGCSVRYLRLLETGWVPSRGRVLPDILRTLKAATPPGVGQLGHLGPDLGLATLPDAVIDEIAARVAARVADLLTPRVAAALPGATPALVDATAVAAALGTTRAWVYDHASELGGMRLGDGARPRWRFNLDAALAARQSAAQTPDQPAARRPRPRRRDTPAGAILTPKPGRR